MALNTLIVSLYGVGSVKFTIKFCIFIAFKLLLECKFAILHYTI
jgi:hypothetical protein